MTKARKSGQASLKIRLQNFASTPEGKNIFSVMAGLFFAIIGILALQTSGAAGFTVSSEAESGSLAGNASKVSPAGSSAGQAVQFGQGSGGGTASYPLKVSSDKRFLTGQNNVPYLLVADTAWNLSAKLTLTEAAQYLDARKNQGFNTILTSMIDINSGSTLNTQTRGGAKLFNGSMGSPNPAYFDHVDQVLKLAEDRGMQLAIWPAWLSFARRESSYTTANATTYGQFLANRYKDKNNLIWVMGGDWGGPEEGTCPYQPQVRAMANAIKGIDQRHLVTYHPGLNLSSTLCYNNDSWLDVNGTYWDFNYNNLASVYKNVLRDYNTSPIRPVLMLETAYESQGGSTSYTSRQQSAYQILAGATGQTYGVVSTYEMKSTEQPSWQATIATNSGRHQGYVGKAFSVRQWWKLLPDQDRSVLTGGNGTYGQEDYALAGRTGDGTLVMAYTPGSRTLTVNMAKLSATATVRWYDTTNGQYRDISGSPFPNSGSRQFATPGNNSAGNADWILIIETNPPAGI